MERLTENGVADTKPALTGGQLAWYAGGSISCGGETVPWPRTRTATNMCAATAGMEAIVYLEDDESRRNTLYASSTDGSGWGEPIPLTGTTGNIGSFSAVS